MKIKTKLTLGVGLLFILIVLLAVLGATKIHKLTEDTRNILVANYNTLDYTRNMLVALDHIGDTSAQRIFKNNLHRQTQNITETGEREATESLTHHYAELTGNNPPQNIPMFIRKDLNEIMKLNMDAIERKSRMADETAQDAQFWITVTGTMCFLIAFTLLINFPGAIANPIRQLTESIKQIVNENYSQRVYFESKSEFGDLASAFNTMAAKLEEYHNSNLAKLLTEKKRIETLINNMSDPVIGLDEHMNIVFANEEASKITGLSQKDLSGKSARDIAVTNDLIRFLITDIVSPPADGKEINKEPVKIFSGNKESFFEKNTMAIEIRPTGENANLLLGHVIVLRNITLFKELDFAKTNFIATVSHELKTPISSIKMSLQLLNDQRVGTLNEEQKKLLTGIKEDSERLLKITGELLNISQLETGKIQLTIQQTEPRKILDHALQAIKTQAEQKELTIQVNINERVTSVKADPDKTAWVLVNLLTNAIRYAPERSEICVSITQPNSNVIFSVKDSGKGIESQYLNKIFERYFKVPGSEKSGTGLGLAISKEFIEAQGGKIWVESTPGQGSQFSFELNS